MGLYCSVWDCESVPTVNICHHCIRAAAGRCWTRRAPREAQQVGRAEWLAPAVPRCCSAARTTANAAADLWCCLQTSRRRRCCKQRVAVSGHEYSMFHHTFRNISCTFYIVCYITSSNDAYSGKYYSSDKVLHSMPYDRLHHTCLLLHSSVISHLPAAM